MPLTQWRNRFAIGNEASSLFLRLARVISVFPAFPFFPFGGVTTFWGGVTTFPGFRPTDEDRACCG